MIKHGEVNPLNVFGLRQVEHCPPHFETVTFDLRTNVKNIADWIYENLSGRFFIGDIYIPDNNNPKHLAIQTAVAFELHEEASFFCLMLPSINQTPSY